MTRTTSGASIAFIFTLGLLGCTDDSVPSDDATDSSGSDESGDGDGDGTGDGDGEPDPSGDGDGDPSGDGDGDPDPTGDGDGEPSGDGDGEPDPTGDGDGEPAGPVCGDGVVEGDEACDDANDIDTDECTNACTNATCGDGIVWEGEEDCDDGNDLDTDACLTTCLAATCGDGIVWEGQEDCDDANDIDTDACLTTCEAAACGDGILHEGVEACDDANIDDDDGCSSECVEEWKFVFMTSTIVNGNMGGYEGANDLCNSLAADAGLPGTYMAWLSDEGGSPSTRFTQSSIPYALVDGTQIASNWNNLVNGSINHPINLTEAGDPYPGGNNPYPIANPIMTGTRQNGTRYWPGRVDYSCDNWTEADGNILWGSAASSNEQWTLRAVNNPIAGGCEFTSPIYCFQQ